MINMYANCYKIDAIRKKIAAYVLWEQPTFRLMHGHIIILIPVNKQRY